MNSVLDTLHIAAMNCFIVCPNFSQGHEGEEPRATWACLGYCSMALPPLLGLGVGHSHFWEGGCCFRWGKKMPHFVLYRWVSGKGSSGVALLESWPEGLSAIGFQWSWSGRKHTEAICSMCQRARQCQVRLVSRWAFSGYKPPSFCILLFLMLLLLLMVFLLHCYFQQILISIWNLCLLSVTGRGWVEKQFVVFHFSGSTNTIPKPQHSLQSKCFWY